MSLSVSADSRVTVSTAGKPLDKPCDVVGKPTDLGAGKTEKLCSDGRIITETPKGNTRIFYPEDGRTELVSNTKVFRIEYEDGRVTNIKEDGKQVTTHPDDTIETYDPATKITVSMRAIKEGKTVGTITAIKYPDGRVVTDYPGRPVKTFYPATNDQKARVEWKEEFSKIKHVQYSDGTKKTIFPTGKVITENPDGTGDIN